MLDREIMKYAGNMEQFAGVRRVSFADGLRDGIRAFEVYNAAGLHFNVLESRCLDIYNLWYKGTHLPFLSKPGLLESRFAELHGDSFKRGIGGGALYTCGLTNAGNAFEEEVFHGRIRFAPAEAAGAFQDSERVGVYGEMRDSMLFSQHLALKRRISVPISSKTIDVEDTVVNRGFEAQEWMILYHLNWGYPLVDENAKVYLASKHVRPMNHASEKLLAEWGDICAPIDGFQENVFVHELRRNADNKAFAGLYNDRLELGVAYSFDAGELDYLVEWKSMASGDYVLGLFPANCHAAGKGFERQNGTIKTIAPFEEKKLGFHLEILDGRGDFDAFLKELQNCTI